MLLHFASVRWSLRKPGHFHKRYLLSVSFRSEAWRHTPQGAMRIQIKTLGSFEVRSIHQELSGFQDQPVRAALLLHLAVEKEATREGVMGLLWPDHVPERARHTLSQTLYRLRKDLGEEWQETKGERLRVTEYVSVDLHRFQDALERGDTPSALTEYRGPFLSGWRFPGTGHFEGWVDRVRIQTARQYREASRDHAIELREAGELDRALAVANTWVEMDPLDDEAQHCLLEILLRRGDRGEALNRFGAYKRLLSLDDLTPLDHTLALMESIRTKEGSGATADTEHQAIRVRTDPSSVSESTEGIKGGERGIPQSPEVEDPIAGEPARKPKARWVLPFAVGLLFLALAVILRPHLFSADPSLVANRVLVIPLENQTGIPDLDPIGRLAADWINQGLSGVGFLEVVPSIEVIPNLPSGGGEETSGAFAFALDLARENRAGIVVYGTYYRVEEGLEFHLQAVEVAAGELLQAIGPIRTHSEDPIPAVDILRQRTMIALGVHLDARLGGMLEEATLPPSYESYLAFLEGFVLFGRGLRAEAIPFLELATELSPEFKAPLIMAGFAHTTIGNFQAAESLAVVVRASVNSLAPYDRHRLEFLESSLAGDREGSLRATLAAAAIQPGGTAHAAAVHQALSLNRPEEAIEIYASLNPDGVLGQVYTPIWNTVTLAHHSLGEHAQELREAVRGRRAQPHSLATLSFEIRALAALGRLDEVAERLEECVNFPPPQLGWTPADVMRLAARELRGHGHADAASRAIEEALGWYTARPGEEQRSEAHRRGLAQALYVTERWEEARVLFEELAAGSPDRVEYTGYLGVLAARLGDPDLARARDASLASLKDKYLFGYHTLWRARIAAQLGNLDGSLSFLREAFTKGADQTLDLLHAEADLDPLRDHPAFLEILRPKG
jgi:DNA-binding SARP family transcriptional activator